jgi:membrane AbrB-like protein
VIDASLVGLVACGLLGGLVGILLRVPLGALIGSIAGAGTYHLLVSDAPPLGRGFVVLAQVLVGSIVGTSVNREVVATMRTILLPALAFSLAMPVVGLAIGWLFMVRLGHADMLTAFLSSAPAGATEMSTAALAFDADAEAVLTAQVLRVFSIALIGSTLLPLLIRRFLRRRSGEPS